MTTADLLNAWRDAVRAAELAERLSTAAATAVEDAEGRAIASAELAHLAEQAAAAAARAAARAAATATEAAALANALREGALPEARRTVDSANATEVDARAALREAEARANGGAT